MRSQQQAQPRFRKHVWFCKINFERCGRNFLPCFRKIWHQQLSCNSLVNKWINQTPSINGGNPALYHAKSSYCRACESNFTRSGPTSSSPPYFRSCETTKTLGGTVSTVCTGYLNSNSLTSPWLTIKKATFSLTFSLGYHVIKTFFYNKFLDKYQKRKKGNQIL